MRGHKRLLEATNGGHYFADCGCGATLGVYANRSMAAAAHTAHVDGREPVGKAKPTVLVGPRPHGMHSSN